MKLTYLAMTTFLLLTAAIPAAGAEAPYPDQVSGAACELRAAKNPTERN